MSLVTMQDLLNQVQTVDPAAVTADQAAEAAAQQALMTAQTQLGVDQGQEGNDLTWFNNALVASGPIYAPDRTPTRLCCMRPPG